MFLNIKIHGEFVPVKIEESIITGCWDVFVGEYCLVIEKGSPWREIVRTAEEVYELQ